MVSPKRKSSAIVFQQPKLPDSTPILALSSSESRTEIQFNTKSDYEGISPLRQSEVTQKIGQIEIIN